MIIAAILATQSRGGLLGIVAVFGVFGAWCIRSKAVLLGGGAVALLGLSVAAGVGGTAVRRRPAPSTRARWAGSRPGSPPGAWRWAGRAAPA